MSSSLSPWLLPYLLHAAKTLGAKVSHASAVPGYEGKKKKVQITEFVSYVDESRPDDRIWAIISDKEHFICAKLTEKAMRNYTSSQVSSVRLTAHTTALATLEVFRPVMCRIPTEKGKAGMTSEEHLVLEVDSFSLIGSFGEPRFGSPKNAEMDKQISLWITGLREPGGGGNVLKEMEKRKPAEKQPDFEDLVVSQTGPTDIPRTGSNIHQVVQQQPANKRKGPSGKSILALCKRGHWPEMSDEVLELAKGFSTSHTANNGHDQGGSASSAVISGAIPNHELRDDILALAEGFTRAAPIDTFPPPNGNAVTETPLLHGNALASAGGSQQGEQANTTRKNDSTTEPVRKPITPKRRVHRDPLDLGSSPQYPTPSPGSPGSSKDDEEDDEEIPWPTSSSPARPTEEDADPPSSPPPPQTSSQVVISQARPFERRVSPPKVILRQTLASQEQVLVPASDTSSSMRHSQSQQASQPLSQPLILGSSQQSTHGDVSKPIPIVIIDDSLSADENSPSPNTSPNQKQLVHLSSSDSEGSDSLFSDDDSPDDIARPDVVEDSAMVSSDGKELHHEENSCEDHAKNDAKHAAGPEVNADQSLTEDESQSQESKSRIEEKQRISAPRISAPIAKTMSRDDEQIGRLLKKSTTKTVVPHTDAKPTASRSGKSHRNTGDVAVSLPPRRRSPSPEVETQRSLFGSDAEDDLIPQSSRRSQMRASKRPKSRTKSVSPLSTTSKVASSKRNCDAEAEPLCSPIEQTYSSKSTNRLSRGQAAQVAEEPPLAGHHNRSSWMQPSFMSKDKGKQKMSDPIVVTLPPTQTSTHKRRREDSDSSSSKVKRLKTDRIQQDTAISVCSSAASSSKRKDSLKAENSKPAELRQQQSSPDPTSISSSSKHAMKAKSESHKPTESSHQQHSAPIPTKKLGGWRIDVDNLPTKNPALTWQDMEGLLLRIGQARYGDKSRKS